MGRLLNHKFWFAVTNKPQDENAIVTLSLNYKYDKVKRTPTAIRIPFATWDSKARRIKELNRYKHLNLDEYNNLLRVYEGRISFAKTEVQEGNMTYATAFDYILKTDKEEVLWDYLKPKYWRNSTKAVKKHSDRLKAIEGYLSTTKLKDCVPLNFRMMADNALVEKIADAIKNNPKTSTNTSHDYLSTLNAICHKQKKDNRPFTGLDLMPSKEDDYGSNPVPYASVLSALNRIKSKQQFEAVIFWLYMFCLTGIDAVDICNTSEDNFDKDDLKYINDNGLLHYHPESMFNSDLKQYNRKLYRIGKRTKNKQNIGGTMFNLFPTLLLHKVLKELIKETHRDYAYKGTDKIRLFNFMTRDKNGKLLESGDDKWRAYRGVMSKNLKKLGMGNGLKQVRDTFTMTGENAGVDKQMLQEYLGHKSKKETITHYRSPSQTNKDTYHSQILEKYNIVSLTKTVLQMGESYGYLYSGFEELKYKDGVFRGTLKPHTGGYINEDEGMMLDIDKLSKWSAEEELELQRLLKEFRDVPSHRFVNGRIIIEKPDPNNMPDELKELILKKEELRIVTDLEKEGYSIQKP